jgi:hypothetical protein
LYSIRPKEFPKELPMIRLSVLEEKRMAGEDLTEKDIKESNLTDIIFTDIESCHRFKLLIDDCIAKFEQQNK